MLKYVVKRLLIMIPIMLGVLLIVFTISYFTPGDPVATMLGTNYTEEAYNAKIAELGLDRPFLVQFADYVVGLVTRFDLGKSYMTGRPVSSLIADRIWITIKLGLLGSAITIIFGMLAGIVSAVKQYSALDYTVTTMSVFFASMPSFWMGLMCIIIFSQTLHWLPASGLDTWKHWILPVLCLGLQPIAVITRMTRSSMLEVIRMDYIRTARAKGLEEKVVIRRHALKNALIPVITIIGMQLSMIMGGSVIIETIFSFPGIGNLMMQGINNRDYPIIQGTVVIITLSVCVINLLVDIAYAYADPRIKAQYTQDGKRKQKQVVAEPVS